MVDTESCLERARNLGAEYADIRLVSEQTEFIEVEGDERSATTKSKSGLNVRVLVDGTWGFLSTSEVDEDGLLPLVDRAVEMARVRCGRRVSLGSPQPVVGSYRTPVEIDPFDIPLQDKIDLLREAVSIARSVPDVATARAQMRFTSVRTVLESSEGTHIDQSLVWGGGGLAAVAEGHGMVQQRSFPWRGEGGHGQNYLSGGYEVMNDIDLAGNAARIGREAVGLLTAKPCPTRMTAVILEPTMVGMQVHESIGHAIEMDRVLGDDLSNFGGSFLTIDDIGSYRYGPDIVNVTADATCHRGVATCGYDDEGVPAQRSPIIAGGILTNLLMSRETAALIGKQSNGTMRAEGTGSLPLIRMTNINLEPGEGSLADIIASTDDGILFDTFRCYDIDDMRISFMFSSELGWEIKNGRITDMIRNPAYRSNTQGFWRQCDAIAGAGEWKMTGLPNCGKGQPWQFTRVGHGSSPARFRNIQVGTE